MSKYYTVTLEVFETRVLTLEIIEVEAKDEGDAANIARQMYLDGSHHFTLCNEDVDDRHIADTTVKEEDSDE